MKIYTNEYSLKNRSDKTIWTSQCSDFKIGIKVDGADLSDVTLLEGETVLSSSGTINGFKCYDRTSGTTGTEIFKVAVKEVPAFNLKHITTDSTVYETDATGEAFNIQPATADKLGGIKVGDGLAIAADGTLSACGGVPSDLSVSNLSSGTLTVNDRSYGECLLSGTYDDSTTFKFVVLSALPPPESDM